MNILEIKTKLEEVLIERGELDAIILEIQEVGSQFFKSDPKDQDYRVVCENLLQRDVRVNFEEDGIYYDFFIFDVNAIAAQQDFSDMYYVRPYLKMYAYLTQLKNVVYGGYDNGWDMLEHEQEYKSFLKNAHETALDTPIARTGYGHGKFYINYYTILKIYQNQKVEMTEAMRVDIENLYKNQEEAWAIIEWIILELEKVEADV